MPDYLKQEIQDLKDQGLFKTLLVNEGPCEAEITLNGHKIINLSSNNYLGFANHPRLKHAAIKAIETYGVGSGAVRTIVGNTDLHERLDKRIAAFKKEEAALVFQSGFNVNAGVIQAVTTKEDLIISDALNHASIIDGVRLSKAERAVYPHSDMDALEEILKAHQHRHRNMLIITDGIFSMDGDIAKLDQIVRLAKQYQAMTYVDDAHGSGVLGDRGRGTVDHFHLHGQVDFIVGTLSKAIGVIGGYVCGKQEIRDWLLNRGRPLLFSTAMMPAAAAAIIEAFDMLDESSTYTDTLWENGRYFKKRLQEDGFDIGHSETPITPVMIGDEAMTLAFSKKLLDRGVYVSGIVFPTVQKGKGRIRCMVSALHTKAQLDRAADIIREVALEMKILRS